MSKNDYKLTQHTFSSENSRQKLMSSTREASKGENLFLAIFYISLSSIFTQVGSVLVKKISHIDPGQLSLIRHAGTFAGAFPFAVYCTKEIIGAKDDRIVLLLRGAFASTGLYMQVVAFRYLPLAEASIVISTMPIVITVIARFYLKESCGFVQMISLMITVSGVFVSVRIPKLLQGRNHINMDSFYLVGLAAALAAVFLRSFGTVFTRKLKHVHFSLPLMYAGFIGSAANAVINGATSSFVSSYCGIQQILCLLVGITGFMESCFYILSVKEQPAGLASVQKASLDIITASVFQIIIFKEFPDVYVISGACLVIVSLLMIGIKTKLFMLPEESKIRLKLKCLLL